MHDSPLIQLPPAVEIQPRGRVPARIYPIGQRDRDPLLVAVCPDGTIWRLDMGTSKRWDRLPGIPADDP